MSELEETDSQCVVCKAKIIRKSNWVAVGDWRLDPIGGPSRGYMQETFFCGKCGIKYQFLPKTDAKPKRRKVPAVRKARSR